MDKELMKSRIKNSIIEKNTRGFNSNYKIIILVLFSTLILIFPHSSIHLSGESLEEKPEVPNGDEEYDTFSNYELVDELESTVEIEKACDYYLKLSPRGAPDQLLELKPQIDPQQFLSTTAQTALAEVPEWLRGNLTDKFIDLAKEDIRLGEDVNSAYGDLDGDGDLDLVCGYLTSNLIFYENLGSCHEPIYVRNLSLFEDINNKIELISVDPSLGDVDADDDLDIVLGNEFGDVSVIYNSGDSYNPLFHSSLTIVNVLDSYSSPCLGDIDLDDDLDILCGAEDGKIYLFENLGASQDYSFDFSFPTAYRNIDVGDRSKPTLADVDNDGDLDLTIGEDQNNLNFYRNTGTPQSPTWRVESTMYLGLPVTTQTSPELADVNGDYRLDLIVGCSNGRYNIFENIGTALEPQWQTWSSYNIFPGIEYYDPITYLKCINHSRVDQYAQIILDVENKMKDEVGFSIAHTATQALFGPSTYPKLYQENAELLYEIDEHLDYANIVNFGSYQDKNYYSTVEYNYKPSVNGQILTTQLPREIYYWYIVHPKITDEMPTYINPESGTPASPPIGRFWRDYLFYHNDTEYPPDPPTDPNDDGIPDYHYPKEEGPPLLQEKLSGIKYVYDNEPYNAPGGYDNTGHNNSRPWGYKDHAIEVVSNWVAKTLPLNEQESADGERPIQPVRIARHHNGNCGELQDLTVAAARTALIPAAGLMLWGEDHVWNEFYERGWHQWDNYWSDGGSVVDNFMNYWVGWNQRGGSGVSKWHGDDYISDVTTSYVPDEDLSTLTIYVRDRVGHPVDGARVMVGSHWTSVEMSGYQVTIPFPSIWNYTDNEGSCTFKVATQEGLADGNKNFSFKVISKIGNAEQGKTELEHGVDYEFSFTLEGLVHEAGISIIPPTSGDFPDRFNIVFSSEVIEGHQIPPNPWVGNYHTQPITGELDTYFFLCNETNFKYYCQANYRSGEPLESPLMGNVEPNVVYSFYLQDNDDWYLVWYNRRSIETYKKVSFKLKIYEKPDLIPEVAILEPISNETFESSTEILLQGTAADDRKIDRLILSIEEREYDITSSLVNDTWSYTWDTTDYPEGIYNISIEAIDKNENAAQDSIKIILTPQITFDITPPEIGILSPGNGTMFFIGEPVELTGTAVDDIALKSLVLTLNSKTYDLLSTLEGSKWSYSWDSTEQEVGEYKFNVRGTDKAENMARVFGNFKLIDEFTDIEPPVITINKPYSNQEFELGEQIIFEGTIEDNVGIESFKIQIDNEPWQDYPATVKQKQWIYIMETINYHLGSHIVTFQGADAAGNTAEESLIILLLDLTPPQVKINTPASDSEIAQGAQVTIKGTLYDQIGIEKIELIITGPADTEKIKRGITILGTQWNYIWEIPDYYPADDYILTATATDFAGNSESDSIRISVISTEEPKEDKGLFGLPGFEGLVLIFALLICILIFGWRNRITFKPR